MNQVVDSTGKAGSRAADTDSLDLGQLSNSLGFLLRMSQVEIFDAYHAELGEHGLKPGEFSVFWLIGKYPGVRQGLIAKSLRIKQAHMTKLVRNLEERGFVTRAIPDDDRRSVLLHQTDAGREFAKKYQDDFFAYFFVNEYGLSESETETLISLLQKFTGIGREEQT